ncbi:Ail/Lom family outer membrane beta-barrel protein, partial [Escherichia coli]|nr:Ail/Lom family outer membrane beta-barrel protein [Escherichia coli]
MAGRRWYASECSRASVHTSGGYLQSHTDMPGNDDLKGINVKYRYEFTDTLGMVTSFSYAEDKNRQ